MAMNLFPVAIAALVALMGLAAVAVVVAIALRRRASPVGPEADYEDKPPGR
jgi:hypothetical protein